MSSYKRIPKSLVKKSTETITITGDYAGRTPDYYEHVEENGLQQVKEKINQAEQVMLEELRQQRADWVEQAAREGFEKAKKEVEAEIYLQREHLLTETKELYEKANAYHRQILEEAQQRKETYLEQEKEQILQLIVSCTEKLLRQTIEEDPEKLNEMFQSILQEITYENKKVFLRVHPKTREWLQAEYPVWTEGRLELLSDGTLTPGDLVVETERECLDATINTQIDALKQVVRSAVYDKSNPST